MAAVLLVISCESSVRWRGADSGALGACAQFHKLTHILLRYPQNLNHHSQFSNVMRRPNRAPFSGSPRESIGFGQLLEKADQLVFRTEIDFDTASLPLADNADPGAENQAQLFLRCACVNILRRAGF